VAPTARLALSGDRPLADALAHAFAAVIAAAIAQAARADADPETAVHEWRKALRRARALERLVRHRLEAHDARRLRALLVDAHHAVSAWRDADVLARALASRPGAAPIRGAVLAERRARHARGALATRLAADVRRLARAPALFASALPEALDARDLERDLARSYRRARAAARRARATRDPADVHALRKRARALAYQLELCAPHPAFRARPVHRGWAALVETLGDVTDAAIVRRALAEHAGALGHAPHARLVEAIDRHAGARLDAALAAEQRLTRAKPRAFAASLRR
jgi:CHAD domain-containing protein